VLTRWAPACRGAVQYARHSRVASFKGARSGVAMLRSGSVSGASRNGERRVEALATHDFVNSVF
jgi:hypothetical protein